MADPAENPDGAEGLGAGGDASRPAEDASAAAAADEALKSASEAAARLASSGDVTMDAPNPAAAAVSPKASAALEAARAAIAAAKAGLVGQAAAANPFAKPEGSGEPGGAPLEMPALSMPAMPAGAPSELELLADVNLNVKIELGRTRMLVEDVLRLGEGSVVELDKLAGDPVDVYVNERHIARGEVLVVNDTFCVRISEIMDHAKPGDG